MSTEEPTRWRVGQLAEATGVTVRSLHHYEEIGLLVPSERTTGGHRLYGETDVQRLYRILALRRLGFALSEIATVLDADRPDLRETVRRHLAQVERDLAQQRRLRQRLAEILRTLERSVEPSVDQFLDTVEAMAMIETTITDVVGHVHTHERLPGKPNIAPVDTRIVLLKERGGDRMLPICLARGEEGFVLVSHLAGGTFSRPVTEDLVARLIELSAARIERVAIDAFREHIYYGYEALAFDNRGTGESDRVAGLWSMSDLVGDTLAVMDAAGLDRPHIVGASMGGIVVQHLALDHPKRVRSLVLACTEPAQAPGRHPRAGPRPPRRAGQADRPP